MFKNILIYGIVGDFKIELLHWSLRWVTRALCLVVPVKKSRWDGLSLGEENGLLVESVGGAADFEVDVGNTLSASIRD